MASDVVTWLWGVNVWSQQRPYYTHRFLWNWRLFSDHGSTIQMVPVDPAYHGFSLIHVKDDSGKWEDSLTILKKKKKKRVNDAIKSDTFGMVNWVTFKYYQWEKGSRMVPLVDSSLLDMQMLHPSCYSNPAW